jgi:sugar/nucleoside kinase (ribokinase family)
MAGVIAGSDGYEVVLDGGYFCDLLFRGLPGVPARGAEVFSEEFSLVPGWTYRSALAFARLGIRTGWLADFGTDLFSRFVIEEARRSGIDDGLFRVHDQPVRRVTAALLLDDDRSFVSYWDEIDIPSAARAVETHKPQWVVVGRLEHEDRFWELIESSRKVGTRVFMDCQDVGMTLETPGVLDAIRAVDVFNPNEREAKLLTGSTRLADAIDELARLCSTVVVKRGRFGSLARAGDEEWHARALSLAPVSTAGAGDCYIAGFLYGLLRGHDIGRSLTFGNIVGGLATTTWDSSALPTEAELLVTDVPQAVRRHIRPHGALPLHDAGAERTQP